MIAVGTAPKVERVEQAEVAGQVAAASAAAQAARRAAEAAEATTRHAGSRTEPAAPQADPRPAPSGQPDRAVRPSPPAPVMPAPPAAAAPVAAPHQQAPRVRIEIGEVQIRTAPRTAPAPVRRSAPPRPHAIDPRLRLRTGGW
jgi:hypothetical protein